MDTNIALATALDHIYPNTHYCRFMHADSLESVSRKRVGIDERRRMLEVPVLRMTNKTETEATLKPVRLRSFLSSSVARFNAKVRKLALKAFMETAFTIISTGARMRVNVREDVLVWSPADAMWCLKRHWFMTTIFGRMCILAAIHAVVAKIMSLAFIHMEKNSPDDAYYQVRNKVYSCIVANVSEVIISRL